MDEAEAVDELTAAAVGWKDPLLSVKRAHVAIDESLDGESSTRVLLLVTDPEEDTWDVAHVRELRQTLGKRATELGLPPVSLTLIAESERGEAGVFAQ
jgi:hypothetical protein